MFIFKQQKVFPRMHCWWKVKQSSHNANGSEVPAKVKHTTLDKTLSQKNKKGKNDK
jgi:hypothetical protein